MPRNELVPVIPDEHGDFLDPTAAMAELSLEEEILDEISAEQPLIGIASIRATMDPARMLPGQRKRVIQG